MIKSEMLFMCSTEKRNNVMRYGRIGAILLFMFVAHVTQQFCLADETPDPFVRYEELTPPVLLPKNSEIRVSNDGEYTVDGEPRYIVGTIYYEAVKRGYAPTAGYPENLKWLYESPLDYKNAQRIGFDSSGTVTPVTDWVRKYKEDFTCFMWPPYEWEASSELIRNAGQMLCVDYTSAPWAHGIMATGDFAKYLPEGALNSGGWASERNHWMPYSAGHPAGRRIYNEMWRTGAEFVLKSGGTPLVYELLNEPAYSDKSEYNRNEFADRMRSKFVTIDNLNDALATTYKSFEEIANFSRETEYPGLFVEWSKFMEDLVMEVCVEGVKSIREVDQNPDVGFCVQPMRWRVLPKDNINMYKLSKILNTTSTTTGGADWLEARFLKSISRGKPIRDGEAYLGKTVSSHVNTLWLQMARGVNATYVFKWDKRAWDNTWQPRDSAEGGKKVGEQFPYLMLNPFAVPTEALTGIMKAKEEMFKVGKLFFPRNRGIKASVALMVSFPTERLSQATGEVNHNFVLDYGRALEFGGFEYDVILEEQMIDEDRHNEYSVIVAAGVDAIYSGSHNKIQSFVGNGGTLILALEAMSHDEYGKDNGFSKWLGIKTGDRASDETINTKFSGNELSIKQYRKIEASKEWTTICAAEGVPIVLKRVIGKGHIYYIAARLSPEDTMWMLKTLLAKSGNMPLVTITDTTTGQPAWVEMHAAKNKEMAGIFFFNSGLSPKLVNLDATAFFQGRGTIADPFAGKILTGNEKGEISLYLPSNERVVLIAGDKTVIKNKFGDFDIVSYETAEQEGKKALQDFNKNKSAKMDAFAFDVDRNNVRMLDLTKQANRAFEDKVAGDGEGGWTDQGENSLRGMEWGVHEWAGVPFEIIRWDHNNDRACVILKSNHIENVPEKVTGIEVGEQVKTLYFLHAGAWVAEEKVMTYLLHHPDGTETPIEVFANKHIGNWWRPTKKSDSEAVPGFVNSDDRGFYVWRWENIHPEKTISSIDIISANNNTIPIVAAITAELYIPESNNRTNVPVPLHDWKISAWNGVSVEHNLDKSESLLKLAEKAVDWGGVTMSGKAVKIPDLPIDKLFFSFQVNGSTNEWNKHQGGQTLQIRMESSDMDGNIIKSSAGYLPISQYIKGGIIDDNHESWQEVVVPLSRMVPANTVYIDKISFQYMSIGDMRAGVVMRDFKITSK